MFVVNPKKKTLTTNANGIRVIFVINRLHTLLHLVSAAFSQSSARAAGNAENGKLNRGVLEIESEDTFVTPNLTLAHSKAKSITDTEYCRFTHG
jgi:Ser-tRNA(Ala) deacylase AlaX